MSRRSDPKRMKKKARTIEELGEKIEQLSSFVHTIICNGCRHAAYCPFGVICSVDQRVDVMVEMLEKEGKEKSIVEMMKLTAEDVDKALEERNQTLFGVEEEEEGEEEIEADKKEMK